MTWRLLPLLPLLAGLAACGPPQDRYAGPQSAAAAAQQAAATAGTNWSKAESVTVTLDSYEFTPAALRFRAGAAYRLTLVNANGSGHTFAAPEFFGAVALRPAEGAGAGRAAPLQAVAVAPGASRVLEFVAVTPGTYELECDRPLHGMFGMNGTLTIE